MTEYILKNALVYTDSGFQKQDILVSDGRVLCVCCKLCAEYTKSYDLTNKHIFPGFVDVHVHLREPGFSYKETIKTGAFAAAKSGYYVLFSPAFSSFGMFDGYAHRGKCFDEELLSLKIAQKGQV